jgi:hypothetical protein
MKIFKVIATVEDHELIMKIADRLEKMQRRLGSMPTKRAYVLMDLQACHLNACPLRLQGLLVANDIDFLHDVHGIMRNFNRTSYELDNCFLPRFHQRDNE